MELPHWPQNPPAALPEVLRELGRHLFPQDLLTELQGVRRLYLCPHRHLFQVPIHAVPLPDGSYPFLRWEVMYAIKLAHVVGLLARRAERSTRTGRKWSLIDESEFGEFTRALSPGLVGENRWAKQQLGVEELLTEGTSADRSLIFCHGQMDDVRPGRARLRLWGGGRLVADDIHRLSGTIDFSASDWAIAACDAGLARIGMQTAPGLALSFVTSGAHRVTSCLYRVHPQVASDFVSQFFRFDDAGEEAVFTHACRAVAGEPVDLAAWAKAASFTSYGLFGT
jgi:hypothetical protein